MGRNHSNNINNIVAIHQPNFLPWLGYFYKIALVDTFVFFDNAEFTKSSFIRRVKIHKERDLEREKYLIVPLKKHPHQTAIKNLELIDGSRWLTKIKAQIHQVYHKAPYFYQLESLMDGLLSECKTNNFSNFTTELIQEVAGIYKLNPKYRKASEFDINTSKTQANIDLIKAVNGDRYISGYGAKKYQDEQLYEEAGISFSYTDFLEKYDNSALSQNFRNKSIISFLACYPIEQVQSLWT